MLRFMKKLWLDHWGIIVGLVVSGIAIFVINLIYKMHGL